MNFHKARYLASYGTIDQLPASERSEIAFAGRSNVGKSSLLNALMYRKSLAKVSSKPGKTATINFFDVDGSHFVDLPGYGYAKVSASELDRWAELIEGYFNEARKISLAVCLIDIRHDPSELDHTMIDFVSETKLPFAIALTKCDKLSKQKALTQKKRILSSLNVASETPVVMTSTQKNQGIDELRALIEQRALA